MRRDIVPEVALRRPGSYEIRLLEDLSRPSTLSLRRPIMSVSAAFGSLRSPAIRPASNLHIFAGRPRPDTGNFAQGARRF